MKKEQERKMNRPKAFNAITLPLIAVGSILSADELYQSRECEPVPPASCKEDNCFMTYCKGPENPVANASLNPMTCDGDWVLNVQGIIWKTYQEGLEFVIRNGLPYDNEYTRNAEDADQTSSSGKFEEAEFCSPNFKYAAGFKIDLGYNTTCDGWDFGVRWTRLNSRASNDLYVDLSTEILNSLLTNAAGTYTIGYENEAHVGNSMIPCGGAAADWSVKLSLIDFEIGRSSWNSERLSLRPFIGLRDVKLNQNYSVRYRGGGFVYNSTMSSASEYWVMTGSKVAMINDFRGWGPRAGLNSIFNVACGWGLYGNFALSICYGKFNVSVTEACQFSSSYPTYYYEYSHFFEPEITDIKKDVYASAFVGELGLGVEWSGLITKCHYGVKFRLGWDQQIFINQNQLFRVNSFNDYYSTIKPMSGDLNTQGATLSLSFLF